MGFQSAPNYASFQATWPELAYIPQAQYNIYFQMAGDIHRNDGSFPAKMQSQQDDLMNMMTAHIAKMFAADANGNQRDIVGRISDAAEGSVHVSTENDYEPGTAQWYQQTKYGSMYWAATNWSRRGFYMPPRRAFGLGWGPWQYSNNSGWPWG